MLLYYGVYFAAAIVSLSDAIPCSGSAKYNLTFKAEWTAQTHPEDFPSSNSPHFSSLTGCTHNTSYEMWKPGINATVGVKDVAEKGRTSALNKEMDSAIKAKTALRRFGGKGVTNTGTRIVEDIEVNKDYPLVSAITMIAPSPDWFVGVHDYSLCNESNGKWSDKRVKDLFLYDSGTDDADTFVHKNKPSNPPVPIFLITNKHEGSLKSNNTIKRFGTFTFEKTSQQQTTMKPSNESKPSTPTDQPSTDQPSTDQPSTDQPSTSSNSVKKSSETTPSSGASSVTLALFAFPLKISLIFFSYQLY